MSNKVFVIGVGMTKFEKPGARDWDYPDMGAEAAANALKDAGIAFDKVQQAVAGYCYGDSTCGQRAIYEVGLTGIPIYNVNNNCATGSTALYLAREMIRGGMADCTLAVGFEKMEKGSLGIKYTDRTNPIGKHLDSMDRLCSVSDAPLAPRYFGQAGKEHMQRYGTTPQQFAKIGWKNHKHSVNNPYAQFQKEFTLDEVLGSPMICDPLTKLQCCPTSDGGAAAVLASEPFVNANNLWDRAVEIAASKMLTDLPGTFDTGDAMMLVGRDMAQRASRAVYEELGLGPEDIDVVELHDCFSVNELIVCEALGLCPEGKGGEFVDSGANTYGGRVVVNPSGGLISKGHPLGATGLAQCAELTWQLRGRAEKRQVPGASVGLQHNIGLGSAVVVTIFRKPERMQAA